MSFLQCSKAEELTSHSENVRYKPLNHSSVTILLICIYVLNMNKHVQFKLSNLFHTHTCMHARTHAHGLKKTASISYEV